MTGISLLPLRGMGEVAPGDDLVEHIWKAMEASGVTPEPGDLLVVAHKVVSKAEGRVVNMAEVQAGPEAVRLAEETSHTPELTQLILDESREVYPYHDRGILMSRHRLGWTCANAAIDHSNAPQGQAILLPLDPDESARRLRAALEERTGVSMPVLISDTHGRPLREGIIGIAVGCCGLEAVKNYVGRTDRFGQRLNVSREAVADELCSAASLCMGQADESVPAVLIRGYAYTPAETGTAPLKRKPERELFHPACDKREGGEQL